MPSKLRKLMAGLSDRLGMNGDCRVHYHLGRPNFGDDINPWFFSRVGGADFRWGRTDRTHVLGIGSVAAKLTDRSVIAGSGFIEPVARRFLPRPAGVFSVRGRLSAEILGVEPRHFGDPVSLIDLLVPAPPAGTHLGLVPHACNYRAYRELAVRLRPEIRVIDPRAGPLEVVAQIAGCARVASQSLHGLIVADAYRLPALWIAPTSSMVGGAFKFRDYFSTLSEPREPVAIDDFLSDPDGAPFISGRYLHDKAAYLRDLAGLLGELCRVR